MNLINTITSGTLAISYAGLSAIAIATTPLSTIAAPVVRTIQQSQASGTSAKLQTINVWNGHGVAISFYEIGETIKKVWLDDPSQILIDTDGCLSGLDQSCSNPGAGLIHLRRIKRVNIPGLPQTSTTLLTVVTQSQSGDRKTYSFRLATSNGTPKYSQVVITSGEVTVAQTPLPQKPQSSLIKTQQTINQIRGGIAIAIKNGQMNYQDELHKRLQTLIGYLQSGDDIPTAANKSSVSQELVNKLIGLSSVEEEVRSQN
ncbi:hypothetical protein [Anabaena azotica]|uniref:Uncharacterized protein n=1 Tax=Anabaena azotica FACHB-119 TaxID=947527 RepID=A0ABR8DGB0_9NOST|nr:hypothetical protein [Anabaena azotica]MBD2505669.1 hypothetical protein [Anabaena azotica FACHB-119]